MTEEPLSRRRGLYERHQAIEVTVRRTIEFPGADGQPLHLDLYSSGTSAPARPAVVLVDGYPDPGFQRHVGCSYKDLGATVSWARLIASAGLAAVAYTNRNPAADLDALLAHLSATGPALGIDATRLGIFACSGHAPLGLATLVSGRAPHVSCAAFAYGYMLDADGVTYVADAQAQFRFTNPKVLVADLSTDTPLLIVRAGRDEMPHLNDSIGVFMAEALRRNLAVTVSNHPAAPHAFELVLDDERSRVMIRQILTFLAEHLTTRP